MAVPLVVSAAKYYVSEFISGKLSFTICILDVSIITYANVYFAAILYDDERHAAEKL